MRRRKGEVVVSVYDAEDREVEVRAVYYAPTSDYFDRAWGNYLPGDPEAVEVLSLTAVDEGADIASFETPFGIAEIEEAVRLAACEPDDCYDTREEARGER